MDKVISDLMRFIVWRATKVSGGLSTLALVKFLYLADLYYAEDTGGQTLTKFPWIFYHFGPYCNASYTAIDEAVNLGIICANTYESKYEEGKDVRWFFYEEKNDPTVNIPRYVENHLFIAIKRFSDIRDLMNHVYFETPPMENAKEKALLDFSTAKKKELDTSIEMKKLSTKKIRKAQECIKALKEDRMKRLEKPRAGLLPIYDDNYYKLEKMLDEEEQTPRIKGRMRFFD